MFMQYTSNKSKINTLLKDDYVLLHSVNLTQVILQIQETN